MDAHLSPSQLPPVTVFIGLGSNWQNPPQQLQTAIQALTQWRDISQLRISNWYQSAPLGPADQPDYLNAVAGFHTHLAPLALLDRLQGQELRQGRVRQRHWGERSLDLDILLYGEQIIAEDSLMIPHPQLAQRAFVLYPLAELVPLDFVVPGLGVLSALLAQCPPHSLQKISVSVELTDSKLKANIT